jgi:hypothetical protein
LFLSEMLFFVSFLASWHWSVKLFLSRQLCLLWWCVWLHCSE